ncbi:MAG: PAS domain-containing protein [Candidatus Melainabacteria bacterium]|nr:PAS domain-containing protein [Candidatus Melainabacteria bacterium]
MATDQYHFDSGTAMVPDSPQDNNHFQRELFEALAKRQQGESEQLELFKDLSDLLPGFIWTATADGQIDYINKRWYEWSGSTEARSLGDGWISHVYPEDIEPMHSRWQESINTGAPYECEYRLLRQDGAPRWHLVRAVARLDDNGKIVKWFGSSLEVHDQLAIKDELANRLKELSLVNAETEEAKQQTAESELLFRTMCEASPELIWTADKEGNAKYFNAQFLHYCGLTDSELFRIGWLALVHPEEREQAVSNWQNCVLEFRDFEIEMRMKRFDGEYRWFLVRSLPIKDESGDTLSWCGSCTDIDTHRRLVTQLKMASEQAQSALKIKSEFVANVSHELRTPLNGILGMVEVLLRGDLSPKSKEHVSTIREAGASLLTIINDILDFSKIEAGKMELSRAQFNPLSVVEGVAEILVPQAAAKDLLLLATVDRTIPDIVFGDPLRLRQVLLNLCGNAIKFTDQGQVILKVDISTDCNGYNQLHFSVIDSGIGISKAFQKRLFEPFMQEEGSAYRSTGGTGLGLSISKHLVELMGGKLMVDSQENHGSTFSFALPLATSADADDWSARAWESSYGQIKLLTLEPRHNNQAAICSHLCALGIAAQSTDDHLQALELLEASKQSAEKIQAICLDTIRYKKQSEQFLEAFKRSKVFGLISVLEIGTSESLSQARSTLVAPRTSHLTIPLRRKQVAACLEHLSGWKPKERKSYTQTRELAAIRNDVSSGSTEPLTQAKRQSGITRRALVADDNKINQQVALLFLQDLGFVVDVTADGIEAVSAFNKNRYDMVFLDCQMPGLDGFEACKIIKEIQQRRGLNVPVIAVTANAISGSREECLDRGMDDYLSKPIDPATMSKLVARWLGVSDIKITIVPSQESTADEQGHEHEHERSELQSSVIGLKKLLSQSNERDIEKILRHFKTRCHHDISEINTFAEQSNFVALKAKMHAFKRACEAISADPLVAICSKIEEACDSQANLTVKKHLVELRRHLKRALSEIERELMQQTTTTS